MLESNGSQSVERVPLVVRELSLVVCRGISEFETRSEQERVGTVRTRVGGCYICMYVILKY